MKTNIYSIIIALLFFLICCSSNMPENFGVYASIKGEFIPLIKQKVIFKGNLLESIMGLNSPSGKDFKNVDYLLIFLEGVNPEFIKLSKLKFKRYGSINNTMIGKSNIEINYWTISKEISFKIAPVFSKKNMYKLNLKNPLAEGFYALHFGDLDINSTIEASIGKFAYDFVIGKCENYPSYNVIKKQNETKLKEKAAGIISKFNNLYNNNQFYDIGEIYWPDGYRMTGNKLETYIQGSTNWFKNAGKVESHTIRTVNISEFVGIITVETVYEKIGNQFEQFTIKLVGNNYVLTAIK